MKSKILSVILTVIVFLSVTSCGNNAYDKENTEATVTTENIAEISTESPTIKEESIEVVNVVGEPADEAQDILEAAGFTNLNFEADKTGDSDFIIMKSNWTVTAQNPTESSAIAPDDEITLICKKTSEIERENTTEKPTEKETEKPTEAPTEKPTEEQSTSPYSYNSSNNISQIYNNSTQQDTNEYVLNTNTMKVHRSGCRFVDKISPENYATTTDLEGALAQGYEPCKTCKP